MFSTPYFNRSPTSDSGFYSPPQTPMDTQQTTNLTQMVSPHGFPPMANNTMEIPENSAVISGGLAITNGHGGLEYTAAFGAKVGLASNGTQCVSRNLTRSDNQQMLFGENHPSYNQPSMGRVTISEVDNSDFQIIVRNLDGKLFTIVVNAKTSVFDLMKKIQDHTGIAPRQQRLTFQGKPIDKERATLAEYDIVKHSTIEISEVNSDFQIFVRNLDGKTLTIVVNAKTSVFDLMKKIQDRTGITPRQQRLTFQGKPIDKERATLAEYDIVEHSTIEMPGRLRGG